MDWCEVYAIGFLFASAADEPPQRCTLTTPAGNRSQVTQDKKGAGHWQYLYHIKFVDDPEPFAQVVTLPRKGNVLDPSASQFKVLNHSLYRKGWPDLFSDILNAFGVTVKSITRLDIAVDSTRDLLKIYSAYVMGGYEAKGRDIIHQPTYKGRGLSLFHWGSMKSNKQAKGYRKGQTVQQENKHYIIESWRQSRLIGEPGNDVSTAGIENVTRFELTLKSEASKLMMDKETGELGLDIARLEEPGYLAGLVRAGIENWFTFLIPSETDSNKSRWEEVAFIDFESLEAKEIERQPRTRSSSQTWRAKQTAKKIMIDCQNEGYLQDAVKEYLKDRAKLEVDESHKERMQTAAKDYLGKNWRYSIPSGVVDDMVNGLFSEGLLNGLFVDIVDEFSEDIPLLIAGKIAKEHSILPWLHSQTQKEAVKAGTRLMRLRGASNLNPVSQIAV